MVMVPKTPSGTRIGAKRMAFPAVVCQAPAMTVDCFELYHAHGGSPVSTARHVGGP
jgi:hypothetical protein